VNWNTPDIPDRTGRTAVITGANTGLGYETAAALAASQYYGPGGFIEMRGYPKLVSPNRRSHDVAVQRRLRTVSEELTGVVYPA
jgi:hypothetical protein